MDRLDAELRVLLANHGASGLLKLSRPPGFADATELRPAGPGRFLVIGATTDDADTFTARWTKWVRDRVAA